MSRCDMCGFDGPELRKIGHEKNVESFKKGVRIALLEAENKRLRDWIKEKRDNEESLCRDVLDNYTPGTSIFVQECDDILGGDK